MVLDNRAKGKSLRRQVPRSSHGEWTPAADRPDPLSLLQEQDVGRFTASAADQVRPYVGFAVCVFTRFGRGHGQ